MDEQRMIWMVVYAALGMGLVVLMAWPRDEFKRISSTGLGLAFALILGLPAAHLAQADGWGNRVSMDGDEITVSLRRDGVQLRFEVDGEVRFTEAEDDIAYLEPRSRMELEQRLDGVDHELVVESDRDGELRYRYQREGDEMPMDAEARAWLAEAIPTIYRATGLEAEVRVARIHDRGGLEAVLEEIELIGSDYLQRRYYEELAQLERLDDDALAAVYRHAGEQIGSDYELRQVLATLPTRDALTRAQSLALLSAAASIGSDFESAELLISVADQLYPESEVARAYLTIAADIGSDFEMNKALDALAGVSWVEAVPSRMLFEASRDIGSDFELAEFLKDHVALAVRDDAGFAAYLDAAATVGSDFELSRVLQQLVREHDLATEHMLEVLELARDRIGSDFERSQLLIAAAPQVGGDEALREAYERAARGLNDHQLGQVMRALIGERA